MVVSTDVNTRMASSIKWASPPGLRHVTAASAYRSSLGSPSTLDGSNTTNTNKEERNGQASRLCFFFRAQLN